MEEQYDVERYFITSGSMLPGYHKAYWLGLAIADVNARLWPNFR
jgi:hypothetical protein